MTEEQSPIIGGLPGSVLPFLITSSLRRSFHLDVRGFPVLFRARPVPPAKEIIHELGRSVLHSVLVLLVSGACERFQVAAEGGKDIRAPVASITSFLLTRTTRLVLSDFLLHDAR